MPQIDLGKVVGDTGVSLRFRGEWNNVAEYVNGSNYIDLVTHNGSLWICDSTNTNQEPSISSEYWSVAAQGMEEKPIIYKSESGDFPLTGEEGILYVDDTISPALMYIWNGSKYIPAGGSGEIAAADVAYNNDSSGLTAENIQEAIDESLEIEKVINENQADPYSPDETYVAGRLVIQNNALWKAKQDISVPEPWTESHWESTTLAAEFSSLNSRTKNTLGNPESVSFPFTAPSDGIMTITMSTSDTQYSGVNVSVNGIVMCAVGALSTGSATSSVATLRLCKDDTVTATINDAGGSVTGSFYNYES